MSSGPLRIAQLAAIADGYNAALIKLAVDSDTNMTADPPGDAWSLTIQKLFKGELGDGYRNLAIDTHGAMGIGGAPGPMPFSIAHGNGSDVKRVTLSPMAAVDIPPNGGQIELSFKDENSVTAHWDVPDDTVWFFNLEAVAYNDGENATRGAVITGVIKKIAGNLALSGTVTITYNAAGSASLVFAVTAANGRLTVTCTNNGVTSVATAVVSGTVTELNL